MMKDHEPRVKNEFIVWTARGAQCLPIGGLMDKAFLEWGELFS